MYAGMWIRRYEVSFWGDENYSRQIEVVHLILGQRLRSNRQWLYNIVNILKATVHFKMIKIVNFVLCFLPEQEGFLGGSEVKNLPANAKDMGLISGLERFSGEGNCNPLQYSCLEILMDRGTCWSTVHGVTKSQT